MNLPCFWAKDICAVVKRSEDIEQPSGHRYAITNAYYAEYQHRLDQHRLVFLSNQIQAIKNKMNANSQKLANLRADIDRTGHTEEMQSKLLDLLRRSEDDHWKLRNAVTEEKQIQDRIQASYKQH